MSDLLKDSGDIQELVLVGRLLSLGAGKASAALDSFSGWLLAGFGAAFALIFGNLKDVVTFVPLADLKRASLLFLFALLLGIFQKLLAAIVSSGTAAAAGGEVIGNELAVKEIEVDFAKVFAEVERATLYPARWLVRRSLRKVAAGDFAVGGRSHAIMTQIQSLLVLAEAACCIAAGVILASGLGA